mgnify:CR=1 FL=1
MWNKNERKKCRDKWKNENQICSEKDVKHDQLKTSKFAFTGSMPLVMVILSSWLIIMIVTRIFMQSSKPPPFGAYVFLLIFIFTWIWVIFVELRKRALKIVIEDGHICFTNYYGIGFSKCYSFIELDGFTTTTLKSRWKTYQGFWLIRNHKKIALISTFYCRNYQELLAEIESHLECLGVSKPPLI